MNIIFIDSVCFPGSGSQTAIQGDSKCADYQGPGIPTSCGDISANINKLVNTHFLCPASGNSCGCTYYETSPVSDAIPARDIKVNNTNFRGVKFMIGASRQFSNGKKDQWTINHNKRLKNTKSGI